MAIRKYGNEPAKVETRVEDNDQKTLDAVKARVAEAGESLDHPETGVVGDRDRRRG